MNTNQQAPAPSSKKRLFINLLIAAILCGGVFYATFLLPAGKKGEPATQATDTTSTHKVTNAQPATSVDTGKQVYIIDVIGDTSGHAAIGQAPVKKAKPTTAKPKKKKMEGNSYGTENEGVDPSKKKSNDAIPNW